MHAVPKLVVALMAISFCCPGQQDAGQLSPRTLFYREQPDNDQLPAPKAAITAAKPAKRPESVPNRNSTAAGSSVPAADTASRPPVTKVSTAEPVIPVVQHLGLRYNVLVATPGNGGGEAADPDRVFNSGECVAFQVEPNRSGYLYVMEQGSSGQWHLLYPSELLPDESNVVRSRTPVRIPAKDCFELNGPAGQERVFVALSRNPEDVYALYDSIRGGSGSAAPVQVERPVGNQTVLTSENLLGDQIGRMAASLQGRDMALKKVSQPESQGEMPNTVYVVNAALTPSDRIVTEIHLAHK